MSEPPSGTVTFLFTDIEGSTRLFQELGDRYAHLLPAYRSLLRQILHDHNGREIDTQGDAFFVAFSRALDAVRAAATAQHLISTQSWPEGKSVQVRMGIHTGEPSVVAGGYIGMDVHRAARICHVAYGGQVLVSDSTRTLVENELTDSLSLRDLGRHRLKDLAHSERLFQLIIPGLRSDFPALRSLEAVPNNLPVQLTSFIGREREIADVKSLLVTRRLLTLIGVGGSGKTRLALQVAADMLDDFPDGIWLIELAGLADDRFLEQTVASTLGLREQPGRPLFDTLAEHLHSRMALIVLDNCEHLISACGRLVDQLLRRCPNIKILATSRESLVIAGEHLYPVPSLSFPDGEPSHKPEDLERYQAIQLFVERARAVVPTFQIQDQNAVAIAEICKRLDGMPLAIELAAPRIRALSIQQIVDRLHDRFQLLTGGNRTALPRQQTLQAAIGWSHDLLSEKEKVLFRRLGVFVSGWSLEAAEAVCSDDGLERSEILPHLDHLVARSLVLVGEHDAEVRYQYLETIRQYARDRLVESGEAERLRGRHRDFFEVVLERIEIEDEGPRAGVLFDRLERDHDNLRVALEWSLVSDPTGESAMRLIWLLWWFWGARGYFREGRAWVETALKANDGTPTLGRAKALFAGGRLAWFQGDSAAAQPMLEESVALARRFEEKTSPARRSVLIYAIYYLAMTRLRQAAYSEAIALFEEAIHLSEGRHVASVLRMNFAELLWIVGDYGRARTVMEEGIAIARRNAAKDREHFVLAVANEGELAWQDGDYNRARARHEEALTLYRNEFGGEHERKSVAIGWRLRSLGWLAQEQGRYDEAATFYKDALATFREIGARDQVALALGELGLVERDRGNLKRAWELQEQSRSIMEELGIRVRAAIPAFHLGELAWYLKDHETAVTLLESSIETLRSASNNLYGGIAQTLLARVTGALGKFERAWNLLREAFQLSWEGLWRFQKVRWLETYAAIAPGLEQADMGAQALGAAEAGREQMGTPLPPVDREDYERIVKALSAALGEDRFQGLMLQGRAMTIEQAVGALGLSAS